MAAEATAGGPMEATVWRPMAARLLTGAKPDGADWDTVFTEEGWGATMETCWAAATTDEEERTEEEGTAETEEVKEEECKLESSMLWCCKDGWMERRGNGYDKHD